MSLERAVEACKSHGKSEKLCSHSRLQIKSLEFFRPHRTLSASADTVAIHMAKITDPDAGKLTEA